MKYWRYKTSHSYPRYKMEVSDQHHAPAPLPRYPSNKRLAAPRTGSMRCIISGFRSEPDGIFDLLRYYAAYSGYSLSTFCDNISGPIFWPLKVGPTGCPETSVWNYHYMLRNIAEERRSQGSYISRKNKSSVSAGFESKIAQPVS